MKKFLLLLLLAGCVSKPGFKHKTDLVQDLEGISKTVATGSLTKPESRVQALSASRAVDSAADTVGPNPELLGVSAVTTDPFLGWYKTTFGFARGEMNEGLLQGLGHNLPYTWRVITTWPDGSVKLAQFKTVAYLNGMGVIGVPLAPGNKPKATFAWHPAVWAKIQENKFVDDLKVNFSAVQGVTGAPTQQVTCIPASGAYKFMHADAAELVIRFRSQCFNRVTQAPVAIYLTSYFTFMSDDPVVRLQNVIGNDQLETPVMGGWSIVGVSQQSTSLPALRWVNEPSFGTKSFSLADGQQMTWKTVLTLDPAFESTAVHLSKGAPVGFQLYSQAKASGAFDLGFLPSTRVTAANLNQAHLEVNNGAPFPQAESSAYLGMIDVNPGATGAQADFSSTVPLNIQKAQMAYSSKQMAAVMLATSRESFRPSHVFREYEYAKNIHHPSLFWWSGRIHYDWSWNQDQDLLWRTRTSSAGFIDGNRSGWNTDDNQHISHNHLRMAYTLTLDPYLEDILKSYISVVYWNYFTDWLPNVEAERAWGRSMKHAIALTELFPDLEESALLKTKFQPKLQAYINAVNTNRARFGVPVAVPFDGCDGRVNGGTWCSAQTAFGQGPFVAVGWMQGFVNEAMALLPNPDLQMLAASQTYYLADGTLKTYFPAPTPGQYVTGGIGYEWTAGWVQLAQKFPNAPGSQFVISTVKPMLEARIQNGCGFPSHLFCLNDSWKSFD